jgi:hypothetical protein
VSESEEQQRLSRRQERPPDVAPGPRHFARNETGALEGDTIGGAQFLANGFDQRVGFSLANGFDPSFTLAEMRSCASGSLVCAASLEHAHTSGYLEKVLRCKKHYDSRP